MVKSYKVKVAPESTMQKLSPKSAVAPKVAGKFDIPKMPERKKVKIGGHTV
jgi:hypothetical protein